MSLNDLHDVYICETDCYFDNKYHKSGEHWPVPAGTEFNHPLFHLLSKAVIPVKEVPKVETPEKETPVIENKSKSKKA